MIHEWSQMRTDMYAQEKRIYGKILWVDDYPSNNRYIISLFESRNIHFDIALNTKQGIQLFKLHLYDAIITDMGR